MKSKASCSVYEAIVRVAAVPVSLEQRDSIQCQMFLLLCKRRRKGNSAQRRNGTGRCCHLFTIFAHNRVRMGLLLLWLAFFRAHTTSADNEFISERGRDSLPLFTHFTLYNAALVAIYSQANDLFIGTHARSQSDLSAFTRTRFSCAKSDNRMYECRSIGGSISAANQSLSKRNQIKKCVLGLVRQMAVASQSSLSSGRLACSKNT